MGIGGLRCTVARINIGMPSEQACAAFGLSSVRREGWRRQRWYKLAPRILRAHDFVTWLDRHQTFRRATYRTIPPAVTLQSRDPRAKPLDRRAHLFVTGRLGINNNKKKNNDVRHDFLNRFSTGPSCNSVVVVHDGSLYTDETFYSGDRIDLSINYYNNTHIITIVIITTVFVDKT